MPNTRFNPSGNPPGDSPARLRLLAVGDLFPPDLVVAAAAGSDVSYLPFEATTPEAIAGLGPDIVLSPLVCPGFDCFDLAEILVAGGFAGRYRAVARNLPNPGLVRREIAARFPGLDFDLVLLDGPDAPEGPDAPDGPDGPPPARSAFPPGQ